MNNIYGFYNENNNVKVFETLDENINMPLTFVKHSDKRNQNLLIDKNEVYYNPSTKTLHADNFSGGIPSLIEGEAIKLTTSNNSTTIDVNFTKNTEAIATFDNADTFLTSNSSNALKSITGLNLYNQLRAGLCPLNSNNIIPNQYLPSSVSDILEVANFAALPTTGDSSKIYVTLDNHKAYRWGGSSYVEISASLVIGSTAGTAYDGGSGTQNANNIALKANLSSPTFTGTVNGITKSMVGLSNVDNIGITTLGGTNLTYTNNKLNLDTDLTSLNSIESSTNTDLKIESNGTGDILLIATPNTSTIGYIHLSRGDDTSQRFNTIAYNTDGNNSYIALNVHYTAGSNNLTRQVLKLNSDLTAEFAGNVTVNSIESETNTDLKLSSSGDILLKGNANYQTIGKIHLARMDNDAIRFNTIEYSNNFNNAYIKFLIHRSGGDNTLTREVLKLNSNLTAEFAGNVTVNTIESSTNTDLQLESNGTGDILLIATPNTSTIGYIHLARADAPNQRFNTIAYNTNGNNSYINFLVHYTAGSNNLTRQVLKLNSNLTAAFAGNVGIGNASPTQALDVTGSIYASLNLDCTALTGGRNNLTDDFYIGNYTNSGAMYMNYSNQQNIQIGKDYLSLFDLSNGTIKKVVQQTGTGFRAIMDFFRKASATSSEIAVGRIECNSTNTFYRTDPSDIRLKEYIKDIENHFDILDKLKPCNFKYKSCDEIRDGFIADDLYKSYPICTSGKPGELNEDGSNKYMMIDTKPLIPILTKCIQGNRQEIKDLKNKVDELELKLNLIYEKLNISYI
jgi:hypothetical protein